MKASKTTVIIPAVLGLMITACGKSFDNKAVEFIGETKAAAFTLAGSADVFQRDNDLVYYDSVNMLMPSVIHNHDISPLRDSIFTLAFDTVGVKSHDICRRRRHAQGLKPCRPKTPTRCASTATAMSL